MFEDVFQGTRYPTSVDGDHDHEQWKIEQQMDGLQDFYDLVGRAAIEVVRMGTSGVPGTGRRMQFTR